jgi:transposase
MRQEPVMSKNTTFIGLDAHKKTITAAILPPGSRKPELITFENTTKALARFVRAQRKSAKGPLRACYEAGPLGFDLKRTLDELGLPTDVIAPSQIWKKPGDHIKTDRRDADKLVRQLKADMLTVVRPPTEEEEAVRDLCRAREDAKHDETAAKNRLTKFLLRKGMHYPGKNAWTAKYLKWLSELRFEIEADQIIFDNYLTAVRQISERVTALTTKIEGFAQHETYADMVAALRCFRGIDTVTAMTIVTELHGFERFEDPRQLMAYLGLVPSEHTSDGKGHRGSITKAGNSHVRRVLVEAAWHYRHPQRVGWQLRKRRINQLPSVIEHADKAMRRLHKRWFTMDARKKPRQKIVVAIARELVGFLWAVLRETLARRQPVAA